MNENKLYIKNMVCDRCILVVKSVLAKLNIEPLSVELGEITLKTELSKDTKNKLIESLRLLGFDTIKDKKERLIEDVKSLIIELVHHNNSQLKENLSDYISNKIHCDYNYTSNLFSDIEGTTIEHYFIAQKIERVKELLVYDELTLSEIAFQLNYSSVAYLSNQFKRVTGLTPSHFKSKKENNRTPLDKV